VTNRLFFQKALQKKQGLLFLLNYSDCQNNDPIPGLYEIDGCEFAAFDERQVIVFTDCVRTHSQME